MLVDVGGVGYELQVPMTTLFQLPAPGKAVTLVTHHAVREDAHTLYSASTSASRRCASRWRSSSAPPAVAARRWTTR
jgi:Holliday junction resolvasome RuvABC DNA-binding subunit